MVLVLGRALVKYQKALPEKSKGRAVEIDGILRGVLRGILSSAPPDEATKDAMLALDESNLEKMLRRWGHVLKLEGVVDAMQRHGFELAELGPYILQEAGAETLKYIIATSPIEEHGISNQLRQMFGWSVRGLRVLGHTMLSTADSFLWSVIKTVYSVGVSHVIFYMISFYASPLGLAGLATTGQDALGGLAAAIAKIHPSGGNAVVPLKVLFDALTAVAQTLSSVFGEWSEGIPQLRGALDFGRMSIVCFLAGWVQAASGLMVESVSVFFGGPAAAQIKRRLPSLLLPFVRLIAWLTGAIQQRLRGAAELPPLLKMTVYGWSSRLISFYANALFPSGYIPEALRQQSSLGRDVDQRRIMLEEEYQDAKRSSKDQATLYDKIAKDLEAQDLALRSAEEAGGAKLVAEGKKIGGFDPDYADSKWLARNTARVLGAIGGEEPGLDFAYVDERSDSFWKAIVAHKRQCLTTMAGAVKDYASSMAYKADPVAKSEAALSRAWAMSRRDTSANSTPSREASPAAVASFYEQRLVSLSAVSSTYEQDAFLLRATAANAETINAIKNGDGAFPSLGKGWAFLESFAKTVVNEGVGGVAHDVKTQAKRAMGGRGQVGPPSLAFLSGSLFLSTLLSLTSACIPPIIGWLIPTIYMIFSVVPQLTKQVIPTWTAIVGKAHTGARERATGQVLVVQEDENPEHAFTMYIDKTVKILWAELRLLDGTAREGRIEGDLESAYSHVLSSFERAKGQAVTTQLQLEMDASREVEELRAENSKIEAEKDSVISILRRSMEAVQGDRPLLARDSEDSRDSRDAKTEAHRAFRRGRATLSAMSRRQNVNESKVRELENRTRSAILARIDHAQRQEEEREDSADD